MFAQFSKSSGVLHFNCGLKDKLYSVRCCPYFDNSLPPEILPLFGANVTFLLIILGKRMVEKLGIYSSCLTSNFSHNYNSIIKEM